MRRDGNGIDGGGFHRRYVLQEPIKLGRKARDVHTVRVEHGKVDRTFDLHGVHAADYDSRGKPLSSKRRFDGLTYGQHRDTLTCQG